MQYDLRHSYQYLRQTAKITSIVSAIKQTGCINRKILTLQNFLKVPQYHTSKQLPKAAMHNSSLSPSTNISIPTPGSGAHFIPPAAETPAHELQIVFNSNHKPSEEQQISKLIAAKVASKEYFYGLELIARSLGNTPTVLDYQSLGIVLPMFASIVWLGAYYCDERNISDVESIRFTKDKLQPHVVAMPHFTCYRTERERLKNFLDLNFSNVLILRGDQVDSEQRYKYAADMVRDIRQLKGDSISIGVGGYPEGHVEAPSYEADLKHLAKKVEAGADFIITQVCFSAENVIKFVRDCRAMNISVPILFGILIPENIGTLQHILRLSAAHMPPELYAEYERLSHAPSKFRQFAVNQAVNMIFKVIEADVGIYGIQFYSVNKFESIKSVLAEIVPKLNFGQIVA